MEFSWLPPALCVYNHVRTRPFNRCRCRACEIQFKVGSHLKGGTSPAERDAWLLFHAKLSQSMGRSAENLSEVPHTGHSTRREAFSSLAANADLRAVVLTGAGNKAFIGGADI